MPEILDVVQEGRVLASDWHEIAPAQRVLGDYRLGRLIGPDHLVHSFHNKHQGNAAADGFSPLFVCEFRDVLVNNLGNYVVSNGSTETEVQITDRYQQSNQYLAGAKPAWAPERQTVRIESACILMRPGDHIFGHWLVDILPRLWLLSQLRDLSKTVFVLRQGTPSFALEMMRLAGVPDKNLIFFNPYRENLSLDRAIYVSNLRANQTVHPILSDFGDWWAQRLLAQLSCGLPQIAGDRRRILVSRRAWQKPMEHRICINATEVENYIARAIGGVVLHPQSFSLPEQIALFLDAEVLIGEEGSGLHNSIFAQPGGHVMTLRGPMNHSLIQSGLCRARNQTLHAVFGETKPGDGAGRESNFSISAAQIDQLIADLVMA
ncbi:DUF563 domain-containing protein [Nitrosomonas sp. Nm33]|uniref:glycosyltransferase family 61 protein n=1 Tax=Nitrosomonas sp. Nm33 TaxID=133724 RepID=UPI00089785BF|nr:glycosyltransferase 61 family protein [Nitrosomonas sp. Nm33]SDY70640.1 Protein of unknown function [Nitrosomonas sp. Nm33]